MGFKKTSELIAVSFELTETGANTFSQGEVALQMDVLNNEIAVILAVDLDLTSPDAVAGANTSLTGSVSSTSQTAMPTLANTNTLAVGAKAIRAAGFIDSGVSFDRSASTTPTGDLDYIGLIATNNFFTQIQGAGNLAAKAMFGRVWLYRAKADSSTYAALVQSEVLSS